MKYIKKFESLKDELHIGDYILMNITSSDIYFQHFINNNLGKLVRIDPICDVFGTEYDKEVIVRYKKIPQRLRIYFYNEGNTKRFLISDVVSFGKTPEDVELRIASNKYNL